MDYFSPDYSSARLRFRSGVSRKGGRLDVLKLSSLGPDGEALTIDIGWFGNESPRNVLVHSSGLHGVEGFAGSAIQLQLLENLPDLPPQGAIAIVHVLNPFGMAWLRRVNGNNVDLNRNVLSEDETYEGMPRGYAQFEPLLNPPSAPSNDLFKLRAMIWILRYGMPRSKEAIAMGQYELPRSLFFGGKELQEEARLYQGYIARQLEKASTVCVIDVHTGLGRWGQDTLLVTSSDYERLRQRFGGRVAPLDSQRSVAYPIRGGLWGMFSRVLVGANVDFLGQEFGTYGAVSVIHSLREENRWYHYGDGDLGHPTKSKLKETFCPQSAAWRESVLARGGRLAEQGWNSVLPSG